MSKWEIYLGQVWKPLGEAEISCLNKLRQDGLEKGELVVQRGGKTEKYLYDLSAMTQTNAQSKKPRKVREIKPAPVPVPQPPPRVVSDDGVNSNFAVTPSSASASGPSSASEPPRLSRMASATILAEEDESRVVQVWLAGEWKKLGADESAEIVRRQAAGEVQFQMKCRGTSYAIDLNHMTQTNLSSQRTRTIRFASVMSDPAVGFDEFRDAFHNRFTDNKLDESALQKTWPASKAEAVDNNLLSGTVRKVMEEMHLRKKGSVDLTEWIHYWAMERDSPSFFSGKEVNDKLRDALQKDPQVLGRMQMHFETAVGETGSHGGLSSEGLQKACERLVASPKPVIEKQWAAEVLEKRKAGEGPDEDAELSYYDFLNVMLGRKKFTVELWMYDISDGAAKNWSWLLLGQSFEGIWHTGVVITWPEKRSEFWYGGALFESEPGTTPFGEPIKKIKIGHTYKHRTEVWNIVARQYARDFTKDSYDVLTHNCNHFSDKLAMFLLNDHIPTEVRKQPEMVMDTFTAKALRPLLNRWLGGFEAKDGRATDGGEAERQMWQEVLPGAIIVFSKEEGGRPLVGQVTDVLPEDCTVLCLDFWLGQAVELDLPRELVMQVIQKAPAGTMMPKHELPSQDGYGWKCWTPSL